MPDPSAARVAIVTGAAAGIGRATTLNFLDAGYHVIACDHNKPELSNLSRLVADNPLFQAESLDVADHSAVADLFDRVYAKLGHVDVLVNNAGIYFGQPMGSYTSEQLDRVIDVNVKSLVYFTQLFAEHVISIRREGVIINISSVAGEVGSSDAVYGMSKAAVIGLTKSNAMNYAPHIRVNAIAPGVVETDIVKRIPLYRLSEYRRLELIPMPILARDVADTVAFLASDKAKHYTGKVFEIDNGVYPR